MEESVFHIKSKLNYNHLVDVFKSFLNRFSKTPYKAKIAILTTIFVEHSKL